MPDVFHSNASPAACVLATVANSLLDMPTHISCMHCPGFACHRSTALAGMVSSLLLCPVRWHTPRNNCARIGLRRDPSRSQTTGISSCTQGTAANTHSHKLGLHHWQVGFAVAAMEMLAPGLELHANQWWCLSAASSKSERNRRFLSAIEWLIHALSS